MKFLFLKREPLSSADGISQFLFALSDALIRLGHEVVCATASDQRLDSIPTNYGFDNYPTLAALNERSIESRPRNALRWLRQGRAFVRRVQPDLIVLNGALPVRFAQPTALLAHDLEQRREYFGNWGRRLFKAATYRLADRILVTCPELVAPVAREAMVHTARIHTIPTCIDTRQYPPQPLAQRLPVILHFGFHPYKNPRQTIAAFAQMKNRSARLVLVGSANPDPSIKPEVAALPQEVRSRIELPGIVSAERLKELLTSARVVAVPSKYLIPVASPTVLEAIAARTPPVVSPDISKLVATDGLNCFVERTPENMARRFDQLIESDETWSAISDGCSRTVSRFDSLTVAAEYVKLAREMMKKN